MDQDLSGYVFDNTAEEARVRFAALPTIFDPGTIRHLSALGVGPGWRCLEVGAGGGSIATWLAERVGPSGSVLATDVEPRFLEALNRPNLEVRRHDITVDPLPEATFDLVHTRLVLLHLPERERALDRMVAALRPGGWLLAEEFDAMALPPDPELNPDEQPVEALWTMRRLMTERGVDLRFGRRLPGWLKARGLVEIEAEGRTFLWRGGSPGGQLDRSNVEQLRGALLEGGFIDEQELERDLARLDDPEVVWPSPILWAVVARRP
jgi:SAM-dependent methyltransferase